MRRAFGFILIWAALTLIYLLMWVVLVGDYLTTEKERNGRK